MSAIAVVYFTNTGNTEAIAELVAEGAQEQGAEAKLFEADGFSAAEVAQFDAFALGCPACGSEELDEDVFIPLLDEIEPELAGKKVVLFGSYGHGGGVYQDDWKDRATAAGLDVVDTLAIEGYPDSDDDVAAAKELGAKLA